jgi:hypothetical protein
VRARIFRTRQSLAEEFDALVAVGGEGWGQSHIDIVNLSPTTQGVPLHIPDTNGRVVSSYAALEEYIRPYWDGEAAVFRYRVRDYHSQQWIRQGRVVFDRDPARLAEVNAGQVSPAVPGWSAAAVPAKGDGAVFHSRRLGPWIRAFVQASGADDLATQAFCTLLDLAEAEGVSPGVLLGMVRENLAVARKARLT